MKIIIDSAIPYIKGVFEPFAQVVYCSGGDITSSMVTTADVLIIRTRTRCDESLLRGSRVKYIATATIGFDHIDLEYCRVNGIEVSSAAGCNARAVLHWMGAVLSYLSGVQGWTPAQKRIGVVGVGNVGRLIEEYCRTWGFEVLCCDPPRAQAEGLDDFLSLEELAPKVDILTLHTPLDSSTFHMVDDHILSLMPSGAVVVNASRGEVVDGEALKKSGVDCVLDVWEREPHIDSELLDKTLLATYHIAGYSKQGKANGSAIVVGDVVRKFDLPIKNWYPDVERIEPREVTWEWLQSSIEEHMDIARESQKLKSGVEKFEEFRNHYNYRDEKF